MAPTVEEGMLVNALDRTYAALERNPRAQVADDTDDDEDDDEDDGDDPADDEPELENVPE